MARIDEILTALQTSDPLRALRMPTYRLHPLKGNRKNEWSVKVTGNRRITFRLDGQDAYDIDLIDYHQEEERTMIPGLKDDAWIVRNPPHPGQFIRSGRLDAADDYPGMTVSEAADKLGVSRAAFSRVVNERRPVTLALAMKMEAVGWSTADIWLELQAKYDIAQARKRLNQPLAAAPAVRDIERMKAEAEVETEVETAAAA